MLDIGHELEPELLLPACHSTYPGNLVRLWLHPYRPLCRETPAARRGVHTEAEFTSACSCSSACPLPPQRCLHLGASELQLVALATLHCQPHALPPASPTKLCRFSSLLPSAPTQEVLLSTHTAHQTERSSGSHRSGCFESPAHQFLGLPPGPGLISPLVHHPRVHPVLVDGLCLTPPPALSDSYFFTSSHVFIIYSVALPFTHSSTKLADVAFSANIA
ncbi:hypothetical protein HDV57DRAFT_461447 [Trichoderma longibrachiatum]